MNRSYLPDTQINRVQKDLKTILKHGDLYDVIAESEDVKIRKTSFIKGNILLLSRILYIGLFVVEKIKNKFAPIKKVKEATDEIRNILGVKVDIIRFKNGATIQEILLPSHLSIFYEEDYVYIEGYVENLKKILNFCELYNINEILLRKKDLSENFYGIPLEEYEEDDIINIFFTSIKATLNEEIIKLDREQLLELIKKLEIVKYDKKVIAQLTDKIKDIPIRNAVNDFYLYGDIDKLKKMIVSRLMLIINSDNTYKDKNIGKIFETVAIEDKYIKVVKRNQKGEIISNVIMTLYDYLEVTSYQTLIERAEFLKDEAEIFRISALYLYLIQNENIHRLKGKETMTFCDKVYHSFCEKQKNRKKEVFGLRKRIEKWVFNFFSTLFSILLSAAVLTVFFATGSLLDFISQHLFNVDNPGIFETMLHTFLAPYRYSYQLEKEMIDAIIDTTSEMNLDFENYSTGDVFTTESLLNFKKTKENKTIATVVSLEDYGIPLPTYYASGYGKSAEYKRGAVKFDIANETISPTELEATNCFFEVRFNIRRKDLKNFITDSEIHFPQVLYPVGDIYALGKVTIIDLKDEEKVFIIDGRKQTNLITEEDKKLLLSMKEPEVRYGYGFGFNLFEEKLGKEDSYTNLSLEEAKESILNGLGLDENASTVDIFRTINNKKYSTSPIKQAGLSHKIKKMDEKEYLESIASMDSIVCNLAAMLAVDVDEELTYVVGYMDSDGKITSNEKHAWAMNQEGTIIDVTPSEAEETKEDNMIASIIKECMDFGISHHLPFYLIAAIIVLIVKKYFGKDITMYIKTNRIEKVLSDPDSYKTYAKIKEVLYGGINIPCEKSIDEFIDMIDKEFASFTLEELQELRRMLQNSLKGKELQQAEKILKEVPYIREHSEELQKVFSKVKNM